MTFPNLQKRIKEKNVTVNIMELELFDNLNSRILELEAKLDFIWHASAREIPEYKDDTDGLR